MLAKCPSYPIFFETVPPGKDISQETLNKKVDGVDTLLAPFKEKKLIDGLCIPHLSEEELGTAKYDSLEYSVALQQKTGVPCVAYKIVADQTPDQLVTWVDKALAAGIEGSCFVGGYTSKKEWAFSVAEANKIIVEKCNGGESQKFSIGNICIPTRRTAIKNTPSPTSSDSLVTDNSPTAKLDEPYRVLAKTKAGCTFFPTQIIWDVDSTTSLLREYNDLCQLEGETPATIVLAISPIEKEADIKFYKSLRVKIDEQAEKTILAAEKGGPASVEIIKKNLKAIHDFVKENKLNTPLGILLSPCFPRNNKYMLEIAEYWAEFRAQE